MHLCIATTGASLATVQAAPRYGQTQTVRLTCKSSQLSGTKVPAQRYIAHARTASARRRATTMGLPIPIVGPLFNPFFAFIAYALGAARFWSNYSRTSFENNDATKRKLTALWPFLFIGSQSFREGFKKTLSN